MQHSLKGDLKDKIGYTYFSNDPTKATVHINTHMFITISL